MLRDFTDGKSVPHAHTALAHDDRMVSTHGHTRSTCGNTALCAFKTIAKRKMHTATTTVLHTLLMSFPLYFWRETNRLRHRQGKKWQKMTAAWQLEERARHSSAATRLLDCHRCAVLFRRLRSLSHWLYRLTMDQNVSLCGQNSCLDFKRLLLDCFLGVWFFLSYSLFN